MINKTLRLFAVLLSLSFILPYPGFAKEYPSSNSKLKYFYVFGEQADPFVGAEDHELTLIIDVPAADANDVLIEVYDPDTTKSHDYRVRYDNPWTTSTRFILQGENELADKTFAAGDTSYDKKRYTFGPYSKTQGRKVGNYYRFKLSAKALDGDDGNLFNVRVKPNSAEVYSENLTFRLRTGSGNKMYFYPEVPAGTRKITVKNYDLDKDGGVSVLYDEYSRQKYAINDSLSAQWSDTHINLLDGPKRRLKYVITKKTQKSAHAGLRVLDENGNSLPIYFNKSATPVAKRKEKIVRKPKPEPTPAPSNACNTFTFDGRSSYDDDKDKITYEWDFGDGGSSTQAVTSHTYAQGGKYEVTLTVSDHSGLRCETSTTKQFVDVNTPPEAVFSASELACVGDEIRLDATGSSDDQTSRLGYSWAFGDGTYGEGQSVTKTYTSGGTYKVNLTVDDLAGSSCSVDSASRTISVNSPPRASAGRDVSMCLDNPLSEYKVVFDAGGSSDADGGNLEYRWDFGDGTTGTGKRVEHTYASGGNYTARVTVQDRSGSACSTDSDSVRVQLNKVPVAVAGKDRFACTGTTISFDAADSYGESGQNLTYRWDFGDGTSAEGRSVTHTYNRGGNYDAVLTVDDGSGSSCSSAVDVAKVHINSSPVASLERVGASCVGDKVHFDASGSGDGDGDSLTYTWDFGDGTVKKGGAKVGHAYARGGTYNVKVTVDDGSGSPCGTSTDSIVVNVNTPPVADAGPNLVCCEEQMNSFNASGSSDADGDTLTYRWDFGDGQGGSGQSVSHAYSERGQYNVSVTVDDGSGTSCSSDTSSFVANVNAKPVPIIKIRQS